MATTQGEINFYFSCHLRMGQKDKMVKVGCYQFGFGLGHFIAKLSYIMWNQLKDCGERNMPFMILLLE